MYEQMKILGKYSASNFFMKRGVELDLENNTFRVIEKIFSIIPIPGKSIPLPKADYLLIFKTLYAKCEACELEDFENGNGSVYQLSIVYNKNRRLIVHETKKKQEVFELAKLISENLHLRIKDSASNRKQPVWLNAA